MQDLSRLILSLQAKYSSNYFVVVNSIHVLLGFIPLAMLIDETRHKQIQTGLDNQVAQPAPGGKCAVNLWISD